MTCLEITAVVLAGGHSSRLGVDKARLKLEGTKTLLENVVERMQHLSADVVVVSNEMTEVAGTRCVKDALPDGGPLGGLYSGLLAARFVHCFVVACDMPFLNQRLLRYMAEQSRDYDVLVPRLDEELLDFSLHPLHAIYAKRCLPVIEQVFASGSRTIRDIYPMVKTVYLKKDDIARFDHDEFSFFNINTPHDLAQAKMLLKKYPEL